MWDDWEELHHDLQYKMFLLNPRIGHPSTTPCSFTIQNVSIK